MPSFGVTSVRVVFYREVTLFSVVKENDVWFLVSEMLDEVLVSPLPTAFELDYFYKHD